MDLWRGSHAYQLDSFLQWGDWFDGWEERMDAVYFDSSKAFDTVSHNILIDKRMKYGLDN